MLMASPGADDPQSRDSKPSPKDICFVLDTSGSMTGPKIEQAKKALNFCINYEEGSEPSWDVDGFSEGGLTEAASVDPGMAGRRGSGRGRLLARRQQL